METARHNANPKSSCDPKSGNGEVQQCLGKKRSLGTVHWVGAINTRYRGKLYAAMNLVMTTNGGAIEMGL
jgi:hypothetical protein